MEIMQASLMLSNIDGKSDRIPIMAVDNSLECSLLVVDIVILV